MRAADRNSRHEARPRRASDGAGGTGQQKGTGRWSATSGASEDARPSGRPEILLFLERLEQKHLHLLADPLGRKVDMGAVPVLCHLFVGHPIGIDPDLENFATHYYHIRYP